MEDADNINLIRCFAVKDDVETYEMLPVALLYPECSLALSSARSQLWVSADFVECPVDLAEVAFGLFFAPVSDSIFPNVFEILVGFWA